MIQQKTKPLQHLIKPAAELRLHPVLSVAEENQAIISSEKKQDGEFEKVLSNAKRLNKIILFNGREYEFVEIKLIVRCESVKNYTIFYLEGDRSIIVSKTLKEFDALLSHFDFVRTHKSHLVNVHYIRKYMRSGGGEIEMNNGKKIPVSDTYKEGFLSLLPV